MRMIKRFRLSSFVNNAYLIKTDKYILIDAPYDSEKIIEYMDENAIVLDQVWLTHYHIDHILGLNVLKRKYPDLKVYIANDEIEYINDTEVNCGKTFAIGEDFRYTHPVLDNKRLLKENPDLEIKIISGHSKASSVYVFPSDKVMFSGDVLFKDTIGRSDLYFGNHDMLVSGIKRELLKFKGFDVFSGHGFKTTIDEELKRNPHIK